MDAPDSQKTEIRFPATRDDFPYSLQAYVATDAGDWSIQLYRAADPGERTWLHANGFALRGRQWVRTAAKALPD